MMAFDRSNRKVESLELLDSAAAERVVAGHLFPRSVIVGYTAIGKGRKLQPSKPGQFTEQRRRYSSSFHGVSRDAYSRLA